MAGFLGKKFPAPVGMLIDPSLGHDKRSLTELCSPPHVAFLRLRYVEHSPDPCAQDAVNYKNRELARWDLEPAGSSGALKLTGEPVLTQTSRPRHPLRCQLGCERHGNRLDLKLRHTSAVWFHILIWTADEYKNDPRNPAVKNQAPNH